MGPDVENLTEEINGENVADIEVPVGEHMAEHSESRTTEDWPYEG